MSKEFGAIDDSKLPLLSSIAGWRGSANWTVRAPPAGATLGPWPALCWEEDEMEECSQDSSEVAVDAYVRLGETIVYESQQYYRHESEASALVGR